MAQSESRRDGTPAINLGWLPIALAACFALSSTTLTTFSVVSPDIVTELGLSYAQTGMVAAAYMLGYGLFQLPVSLLGDRLGHSRVLIAAATLMSVASLLPCLASSFAIWLIARLLMGIGGAAVLPLSLHLLTQEMSGPRLARGIGLFVSGWGIGMTIAMLGAAPLLDLAGWRQVMLATTLLGAVVIAGMKWVLPTSESGGKATSGERSAQPVVLRAVVGNSTLNLMGLVNAAGTTIMVCIPAWLPLYLAAAFKVRAAEASALLSPIGIGVAFGAWLGGALAVPLGWRAVVVGSLLSSCVLAAFVPLQADPLVVAALAILIGLVGMLFPAPIQSLFPLVVSEDWTAVAAAYYNTIGFFGAFGASLLFGYLVDQSGSFTAGWLFLAGIPLVGIAAALSLSVGGRRRSKDG
jgi:MFS transporter, ACS family, hexuronate transporter